MKSTTHRIIKLTVAAALVVSAPLALTGCSQIVGGIVHQVTGVDAGGSVPADFPSDVPIVQGKVDFGIAVGSGKDEGWNVTIEAPDGTTADSIAKQFTDAGWTAGDFSGQANNTSSGATFTKDDLQALVVFTAKNGDSPATVNYTIARVSSDS